MRATKPSFKENTAITQAMIKATKPKHKFKVNIDVNPKYSNRYTTESHDSMKMAPPQSKPKETNNSVMGYTGFVKALPAAGLRRK